jgi:hypothetical protein
LKLKCDKPISNFAFNFNSRRYSEVAAGAGGMPGIDISVTFDAVLTGNGLNMSVFELAMEVTGEFAIGNNDFEVYGSVNFEYPCTTGFVYATAVGRCRLTISKPVLKVPMVSALGN